MSPALLSMHAVREPSKSKMAIPCFLCPFFAFHTHHAEGDKIGNLVGPELIQNHFLLEVLCSP